VVGSLTHTTGYRGAVVGRSTAVRSVGIDAEPHDVLPDGVLDSITLDEERHEIAALPVRLHWDRILFCAKEATFEYGSHTIFIGRVTSIGIHGEVDPLIYVVTAAFGAGMYLGSFRALTAKGVPTRSLLPGATTGGILWTVLQVLGTWLVHRFLHSSSVYGVFATVLGLLAWIYLAIEITVYSAEINVVLARRLWPRSIVQPPLTEADRASMALQALQNQRRPEQHVEVTFDDRKPDAEVPARTPQTPDEVAPPAEVQVPEQRTDAAEGATARPGIQ